MSTVKTPILNNVSSALTTIYTNSSGGNAILKTTDIVGNSDGTLLTKTGGDDWSFFGTGTPYFALHPSYMTGAPYPVRLGANRVLLINTPHHLNYGCTADFFDNNNITTQICEYQTNKYVCGPIVFAALPDPIFDGTSLSLYQHGHSSQSSSQLWFKAIALTSTKVLLIYRTGSYFKAVRLTISGNQVDVGQTVSFNLYTAGIFSTTTGVAQFDVVALDTDKIIVISYNSGTSNNGLVPLNIPNTGAITNLANYYALGYGALGYGLAIAKHTKVATANVYSLILGMGTSIAVNIQMCTFNASSYTFGTTANVSITGTVTPTSLSAMCLSNDTNGKSVIAFTETGGLPGYFRVAYQTGATLATNTATSVAFGDGGDRPIYRAMEWGDDRAVFLCRGNGICSVDNTGAIKNLMLHESGNMLTSTNAGVVPLWFPFDSRPLFTCKGTETNWQWQNQYFARINIASSTSVGEISYKGNYLPYGHNYGGHYAWSEKLGCWLVGFGCKIFAVSSSGVVLSETSIRTLDNNDYTYKAIRGLVSFPSGKVIMMLDSVLTNPSICLFLQWNQYNLTMLALSPIKTLQDLSRATLSAPWVNSSTTGAFADLMGFVDVNGQERGASLWYYTNSTLYYNTYDGTGWSAESGTSVSGTTVNTWNVGVRAPYRWVQDSPCDMNNPQGLWRIIGGQNTTTLATICNTYISGTAYAPSSFGSLTSSGTQLSGSQTSYRMGLSKQTSPSLAAVALYDYSTSRIRLLISNAGRLNNITGFLLPIGSNARRYSSLTVCKSHISIAAQNTAGGSMVNAQACVFDINFLQTEQYAMYTATGSNWLNNTATTIYTSKLYGSGIDVTATSCPVGEIATFNVVLNNGTANINLTPVNGLPVVTGNSNRSNTSYLIPNGGTVKVSSNIDSVFDVMLGIVEEI